jgi:hypothetical protein
MFTTRALNYTRVMAIDCFETVSTLAGTLLRLLGLDFGSAIFAWSSRKIVCLIAFGSSIVVFSFYSEYRFAMWPPATGRLI